jgi:hypothetical protein
MMRAQGPKTGGTIPSSPAGKPRHIRAAHFFADCGMGNFWSTFRKDRCDTALAHIRGDGFSHIILIVPWAQFQPRLDPTTLDAAYVERLHFLLDAAERAGLRVITRLGYLWEFTPVRMNSFQRFANFFTAPRFGAAWSAYFRDMHALLNAHPAFDFAFVSWEDWYWPVFRRFTNQSEEVRTEQAHAIGFVDFMRQRWSLADLNTVYGVSVASWDKLAIPRHADMLMLEFASFHDVMLSERIVGLAAAAFPDLGYESRVDAELVVRASGVRAYQWRLAYTAAQRHVTFYHPNIGTLKKQKLSAARALQQLNTVALAYAAMPGANHKVFIDQFNFVTSNPEYPHFSSIDEAEMDGFLEGAAKVLHQRTSGYGVWGYRDWPNDKIYNGAFEFGLDGWETAGEATLLPGPDARLACGTGAEIAQRLYQGTPGPAILMLEATAGGVAACEAEADGDTGKRFAFEVKGGFDGLVQLPFQATTWFRLRVRQGALHVARIGLCSHIYSSGLYERDMTERPAVAAIRRINRVLAE